MNDYSRQNCRGCIHKKPYQTWYCDLHKHEPATHCKDVKFAESLNGRPPRIPNPPTKPVG